MSHPLVEQLRKLNRDELMQLFDLLGQWQDLSDEDKERFKAKMPYLAETLHNYSHIFKIKRAQ